MKPSQNDQEPVVIIPLSESADVLTIRLAAEYVDDGNLHYLHTMPAVLAAYHLTPVDYWNLTVAEHETLMKALTDGG